MCHSQDALQPIRVDGSAARVCCSVAWGLLRGGIGEIVADDDEPVSAEGEREEPRSEVRRAAMSSEIGASPGRDLIDASSAR
jgi:hypothetical protein